MTDIQERLGTGKGKFTPQYPELGTGPVNYEDAISPEFFEAEREAIFQRSWLYVGRSERIPRPGSYFTRELPGRLASIVVTRGLDGTVQAFHNVCAHRGNKVVWQEHPQEESSGSCRQFSCKYHGWRYDLEGKVAHVTNEQEFFDLDPSTLRMPPVACEEFAGFVFVNLGDDPVPLRHYLGERILELEAYPFERMTQRYGFSTRIHGNWKLAIDSVCEWYHPPYVHGRFIDKDVAKAEKMVPPVDAYHYDLFPPHMLTSVPGPPPLRPREPGTAGPAARDQRWVYRLFRAGLFGPDDVPDLGDAPGLPEQGRHPVVGQRPVLALPEPVRPDLGSATTTSPTRTGRSRSTRTSTRSTCTSCRRRTPPTAWRRSSSSTAPSSSRCRTSTRSRRRTPRWRRGRTSSSISATRSCSSGRSTRTSARRSPRTSRLGAGEA